MKTCYKCSCEFENADVRPYGPNGEDVCFDCAFSTPEDAEATERAADRIFGEAFAHSNVVILDGESAPYPFIPDEEKH